MVVSEYAARQRDGTSKLPVVMDVNGPSRIKLTKELQLKKTIEPICALQEQASHFKMVGNIYLINYRNKLGKQIGSGHYKGWLWR